MKTIAAVAAALAVCLSGTPTAVALEASITLQVNGSNVVSYDIVTGAPAKADADLIVTADAGLGSVSTHLDHLQYALAGQLFTVTTAADPANGWLASSIYSGPLAPKSTSRSTTPAIGCPACGMIRCCKTRPTRWGRRFPSPAPAPWQSITV